MKAIVNGVSLEGTPQEIAEYLRITSVKQALPDGMIPLRPLTHGVDAPHRPDVYVGTAPSTAEWTIDDRGRLWPPIT
ncbi:hypothetical protein D3C71_1530000 [compost metagenome]